VLAVFDSLLWVAALVFATYSAFEFSWDPVSLNRLVIAVSIAVAVQVTFGFLSGLYYGRWRLASFDEVRWLAISALLAALTLFVVVLSLPDPHLVPLSAVIAAGAFQGIGAMTSRYLARLVLQLRRRSPHERSHRLLIFGAGEAGHEAARDLFEDPETDMLPVAFLDDNPAKSNLRLFGLRVAGTRDSIRETAE
jgi:FlaA1/EpsC-like NDP-sugar epimerase